MGELISKQKIVKETKNKRSTQKLAPILEKRIEGRFFDGRAGFTASVLLDLKHVRIIRSKAYCDIHGWDLRRCLIILLSVGISQRPSHLM